MKAKYILGEMILSWSDNRARSPAMEAAPEAGSRGVQLKASTDTSRLTTESHETHHDLFSFTKTGEHFVLFWFGLSVCIYITHLKKKKKIGNTIKNIFVGRKW